MKYKINFDANRFMAGVGKKFPEVKANLDGDWICYAYNIPMDRFYSDLSYQRVIRTRAMEEVEKELKLPLIPQMIFDTGVVLNASLFGGAPQYHSNSTPVLAPVIRKPSDVYGLAERIDRISDEALMYEGVLHQKYWEAAEYFRDKEGRPLKAPSSGGGKGIATIGGQLCGVTNFLIWLMMNPDEMKALTDLIGRTLERYIRACRQFDGEEYDGLSFASDLAGLMSPDHFAEFCAPWEQKLYEAFAPTGIRHYHSDSNMSNHVPVLKEMGVTDVNIGPMISVSDIFKQAQEIRVQGQVPPVKVLWQGSTDLVVDAVRQDINETRVSGKPLSQLTVCTAGSINPGTPLDNIRAMFWAAMEFGVGEDEVNPALKDIPVEFDRKEQVNQIS